jgi:signal peptidase II
LDTAGSEAGEQDPAQAAAQPPEGQDGGIGEAAAPQPPNPEQPNPEQHSVARRRIGVLIAVAAFVYAADIVSKAVVVAAMAGKPPIHVIGTLLQLNYTRNPGAAFSIGASGYTVVFTLIAAGVVTVILRLSRTLVSARWAIALGLLLGGALGNLTDRVFRAPGPLRGWVVDFIQLPHWPIFNVADSAICCGGVLMVLLAFLGLHPDGRDERHEAASGDAGEDSGENAPGDEAEPGAAPHETGSESAAGGAAEAGR